MESKGKTIAFIMKALVDKLEKEKMLRKDEFIFLLNNFNDETMSYIFEKARNASKKHFGNRIYTRGLIEFTNYCKNDCYYCGIRRSNHSIERYRLNKEEIWACCRKGHSLGFRTFVLQGGEDPFYSDEDMVEIISGIRRNHPDCAITLSIGEKSHESYLKCFQAGADRYLLRHETANLEHYRRLHPGNQSALNRRECLKCLKETGYQVGTGIMVGSPWQTTENIVEDLFFMKEFSPEMIGIGPYVPHHETPFAHMPQGSLDLTLVLISILRLMIPSVLMPATTALGTIDPNGREKGILAGANVLMPNLSPVGVRKKYSLYDNKACTGEEAAECRNRLEKSMKKIGYEIVVDRGDFIPENKAVF